MTGFATVNPATGETLAEFPFLTDDEVQSVLQRSARAYTVLRAQPLAERTAPLARAAALFRERADELAALITLEMGKPIRQALGEVQLAASIWDYYAAKAETLLADERLEFAGSGEAIVRTEPIGPVLGVMPWNFPYYQVARFAAPNLALGNTIILKHAPSCPQSALAIERLLHDAGLTEGAYLNVFIDTDQVADVIADPRVQGVSVTGSERAGSAVAEVAGRNLKRCVLELGGSDPFLVLDDADIDQAVRAAVGGRVQNSGQACTASKRFIVVDAVYDEFAAKFIAAMTALSPGDPTDPQTFVGPLSSVAAADRLREQVEDAVAKGATLHTAPGRRSGGAFYPPEVLTGVTPEMRAYHEELFGPTAVLYRVPSRQTAVELANSSAYGLSSSVFTQDREAAEDVASRLETGMVWVNSPSGSAADLPFGGIKRSGVGRELAKYGIDEFANKKLVRTP